MAFMPGIHLLRRWPNLSENDSHPTAAFDINGFDATLLDIPALLEAAAAFSGQPGETQQAGAWTLHAIRQTPQHTILRLDPDDPATYPSLKIKRFHTNSDRARRAYQVLRALYDFGVNIGPRPFFGIAQATGQSGGWLICEWIHGEVLKAPPDPADEEMWHRVMAVMGVSKNLPFRKYANQIPMEGRGVQQPADVLDWIEKALADVDATHPDRAELAGLVAAARDQAPDQWLAMPKVALSRLDPSPDHYVWDGHHLRGISWGYADWSDVAFDLAQMAAHPLYASLPAQHWVWFRWEYARLTHDETAISRATTYTRLMTLYWAVKLTAQAPDDPQASTQRDRYLKEARRYFG